MKVCGIELKSNEARIVVLDGNKDDYTIVKTNIAKLKIDNPKDQKDVIAFKDHILEFFKEQDLDLIAIKERMTKGRFSGGSTTFKMEALIQTSETEIQLVHGMTIKSKLKNIEIETDGLPKYQEEAFKVALYLLVVNT